MTTTHETIIILCTQLYIIIWFEYCQHAIICRLKKRDVQKIISFGIYWIKKLCSIFKINMKRIFRNHYNHHGMLTLHCDSMGCHAIAGNRHCDASLHCTSSIDAQVVQIRHSYIERLTCCPCKLSTYINFFNYVIPNSQQ